MTQPREAEFRTPTQRFFGAIDSTDEARIVIREMSVALLIVAALLLGLTFRAGFIAAASAVLISVPAALLLASRRREAAVAALVSVIVVSTGLLALGAIRGLWPLVFWVAVLEIAGRANRAAFKLHEFESSAAGDVPEGPSGA